MPQDNPNFNQSWKMPPHGRAAADPLGDMLAEVENQENEFNNQMQNSSDLLR